MKFSYEVDIDTAFENLKQRILTDDQVIVGGKTLDIEDMIEYYLNNVVSESDILDWDCQEAYDEYESAVEDYYEEMRMLEIEDRYLEDL